MPASQCTTLSPWLDRILIGAVGLIIVWFGGKLEMLNTTVQRLCETMAANGVELKAVGQRVDRIQFEQDALKNNYETYLREDRQKFYLVAKECWDSKYPAHTVDPWDALATALGGILPAARRLEFLTD